MDAYELIMEDEDRYWQLMISALPSARSPQDKKGSKALLKYMNDLRKGITEYLTPWVRARKVEEIRERLKKPPKGVVYDEAGKEVDLNDPDWWKK